MLSTHQLNQLYKSLKNTQKQTKFLINKISNTLKNPKLQQIQLSEFQQYQLNNYQHNLKSNQYLLSEQLSSIIIHSSQLSSYQKLKQIRGFHVDSISQLKSDIKLNSGLISGGKKSERMIQKISLQVTNEKRQQISMMKALQKTQLFGHEIKSKLSRSIQKEKQIQFMLMEESKQQIQSKYRHEANYQWQYLRTQKQQILDYIAELNQQNPKQQDRICKQIQSLEYKNLEIQESLNQIQNVIQQQKYIINQIMQNQGLTQQWLLRNSQKQQYYQNQQSDILDRYAKIIKKLKKQSFLFQEESDKQSQIIQQPIRKNHYRINKMGIVANINQYQSKFKSNSMPIKYDRMKKSTKTHKKVSLPVVKNANNYEQNHNSAAIFTNNQSVQSQKNFKSYHINSGSRVYCKDEANFKKLQQNKRIRRKNGSFIESTSSDRKPFNIQAKRDQYLGNQNKIKLNINSRKRPRKMMKKQAIQNRQSDHNGETDQNVNTSPTKKLMNQLKYYNNNHNNNH